MAANIEITQTADGHYNVRVTEGASHTTHHVTLKQEDYLRITQAKIEPRELIRLSFTFLLDHEPKESILAQFDLSVIRRYFPHFDREIARCIAESGTK